MAQLKPADILVRPGSNKDFINYLKVCQRAAANAYRLPGGEELFSVDHYFHPDMMSYWEKAATNTVNNKWWIAEVGSPMGQPMIVGGICLRIQPDRSEGSGFYVDPDYQGQGIGRALWATRQKSVKGPLYFEVYSHATRTIAYHTRHGAVRTGRHRSIHWDSWPKNINLTALEFISQ